ncbi:nitric oxide-sensing protein NosP [Isoalcanivorax beigongshangi]|uniref:Nitric oxide-sensing protein NosP n=1 Tax=Isoalcanivorax beigongshangi TaxID=3238810 RepID=A0ABV4AMG1_9GAMM
MTAPAHDAVIRAFTTAPDEQRAADELAEALRHPALGFVLFFCSMDYDLPRLATALEQAFGDVPMSGCTSCGELTPEGYATGTITALGFHRDWFSICHRLITPLDSFRSEEAVPLAESLIQAGYRQPLAPSAEHSFVFTMMDGLSFREELVLASLSAALGSIPFFGGSAGDGYNLTGTYVYDRGRFYRNAAAVVMVSTALEFEVFSSHHLLPTTEKLVVTSADALHRKVYELNAEPAADVYARLVGVSVPELNPAHFATTPLAVCINERYYARAIQRVNPDRSLSFYCAVENGIVLTRMENGPLLDDLVEQMDGVHDRLGTPWVTLTCDCCLRGMELSERGTMEQASRLVSHYGLVGFSTYGEQINGMHINHTLTGVAIGRRRRTPQS